MKLRNLIKDLRRKLRRDEDNLALRLELADLCRDDGNHAEALETYREVAISAWQAGRLQQAQDACERALTIAPQDVELNALIGDIDAALGAPPNDGESRNPGPKRRAKVWHTAAGPATPAPVEADKGQPRRSSQQRAAAPEPQRRGTSELTYTPTPLPAPLPLHDAADDSLLLHQPVGIKAQPSGPVPTVSMPADIDTGDDDVLALAGTGDEVGQGGAVVPSFHPPGIQQLATTVDAMSTLGDSASSSFGDDDEEEEITDVRGLGAETGLHQLPQQHAAIPLPSDGVPSGDNRDSQDLTAPLARVNARVEATPQSKPSRSRVVRDSRPVAVSGEISISDRQSEAAPAERAPDASAEPREAWYAAVAEGAGNEDDEEEVTDTGATTQLRQQDYAEAHAAPQRASTLAGAGVDDTGRVAAPLDDDEDPSPTLSDTQPVDVESVDEDKLVAEQAAPRGRRRRRAAASTLVDMAPPVQPAMPTQSARAAALATIFPSFPAYVLDELAERITLREFRDGEEILQQGQESRACYLVMSGSVRLSRRARPGVGDEIAETGLLTRGALFGVRSLLPERTSVAAAHAAGPCRVYEVPRRALRELAAIHHTLGPLLEVFYREHLTAMLLHSAPFLSSLPAAWRDGLQGRFRPLRRAAGESILRQGERTGGLYLVVLGAVEIVQRLSPSRAKLLATIGEGCFFSDMSVLAGKDETAGASVSAAGPLELAVLPAEEFSRVLAEAPALWRELCEQDPDSELLRCSLLTGRTRAI